MAESLIGAPTVVMVPTVGKAAALRVRVGIVDDNGTAFETLTAWPCRYVGVVVVAKVC